MTVSKIVDTFKKHIAKRKEQQTQDDKNVGEYQDSSKPVSQEPSADVTSVVDSSPS